MLEARKSAHDLPRLSLPAKARGGVASGGVGGDGGGSGGSDSGGGSGSILGGGVWSSRGGEQAQREQLRALELRGPVYYLWESFQFAKNYHHFLAQHAPKLADFLTLRARLPRRAAAALQLLLPWHRDTRLAREVLRAVGGTRRRRRHPSPLTPRRPPRWTPDPRSLTRLRGVRCVCAQ